MTSAIMQPTFNPWLGYFDLIDQVETFVFLDNVQLVKRSWQVRNKIKLNGEEFWLTIPVKNTSSRDYLFLKDAEINNEEKWKKKHLSTIQAAYSKSFYYDEVMSFVSPLYESANQLSKFNIDLIIGVCENIGIKVNFINASNLTNQEGIKDEKLNNILNEISSKTYISPQGSAGYINSEIYGGEIVKSGKTLYYHVYNHPNYLQNKGDFIPYLGIFDVLFNVGFKNTLELIRQGRRDCLKFDEL